MSWEEGRIHSVAPHMQMKVQLTSNLIYLWKLSPKWSPEELLQGDRWTVPDFRSLLLFLSRVTTAEETSRLSGLGDRGGQEGAGGPDDLADHLPKHLILMTSYLWAGVPLSLVVFLVTGTCPALRGLHTHLLN